MPICDVCGADTTFEDATVYTSDEFRRVTAQGFLPDESVLTAVTSDQWKEFVARSAEDWVLCPKCAASAVDLLPKASGTGLITPRPRDLDVVRPFLEADDDLPRNEVGDLAVWRPRRRGAAAARGDGVQVRARGKAEGGRQQQRGEAFHDGVS